MATPKKKPSRTTDWRDNLADAIRALPAYNDWHFEYEYPGYFVYSHEDRPGLRICCTPDWECKQAINVQVEDNGTTDDTAIVAWPKKGRTRKSFVEAMKPWLDKYQPDAVTVCCGSCGSPNVSYAIWFHPNNCPGHQEGDCFGTWNAGDSTFCDDCEENSDLVDKGADPKAFVAARAKWREAQANTDTEEG